MSTQNTKFILFKKHFEYYLLPSENHVQYIKILLYHSSIFSVQLNFNQCHMIWVVLDYVFHLLYYLPFIYFIFVLLFKYSCLHFHPTMATCPTHPCLPPLNLPSLTLSICLLYMFLDGHIRVIPYYPSPPSSLVTVSLFFILMSLIVFCLLVCFFYYVSLILGEIISYFSFTAWLISFSIMLSSSIHAVVKVGAPSFSLLRSIPLCKCTTVF